MGRYERREYHRTVVREMIGTEILRQDDRFGVQNHIFAGWMIILGEEFGEAAKAVNKYIFDGEPYDNIIEELVHTAAVAIQAAAAIRETGLRRHA